MAQAMRGQFVERDAVIEGMVCAALAGENVLLLGPPGTAKSALARALCEAVDGSQYFEWLLSKFSAPEELYGPISLTALKADRYERITAGKLPECHVAFLDEIFKANSGILNSLLTAINERKFHNGAAPTNIPLRMVVGASNELPEGPELGALYDRFLLRYWVDYVSTPDAFVSMVTSADPGVGSGITLAQWDEARAEVAAVTFDQEAARALYKLRIELASKSVHPSDRRFKRAAKLLRANAWMSEDSQVSEDHFGILADVLWDNPEQRTPVAEVVNKLASSILGEANKIVDMVSDQVENLPAAPASPNKDWQDRLVALNRDGNRAVQQLKALETKARNARQRDAVGVAIKTVTSKLGPVRQMAREALGL